MGGGGLRPLADLYLFLQKKGQTLDRAYLEKQLEALHILAFARRMARLAQACLEGQELDQNARLVGEYLTHTGIYGDRATMETARLSQPEGTTSRGQSAAILYRAAESPAVSGGTDFSDVEETAYYADAIRWASANGVVTGYADGTFRSDAPVTRQQMAAILWRYAGRPAAEAGTDFADESVISDYASTAMDWARSSGLISGRPGNMFDPYGRATRAQTAVILFRYQNGIEALGDGTVRTTAGLGGGTNGKGIYRYLGVP